MPKNLLVADDSVTIQKVVGIVFAHEDYRVIAAGSGEEAIRLAHEHRPEVVLADCGMPGMSGYDLCAAIKADPRLADVPVILLAGTSEPLDDARARAARADGHVVKPFDSQALLSRVRELVEGVTPEPMPAAYPRTTPVAPSRPAPSFTPAPAQGPAPVAASAAAGAPPRRAVPPPLPPPGHPSRVAASRPAGLPVPSVPTAGVRPPPPGAARPPAAAPRSPAPPPGPAARPPAPPRPAPPPARPPPAAFAPSAPGPAEDDWSDLTAATPAPSPVLRSEPAAPQHAPVPQPQATASADGGEAALRLALSQASREVVERIAWEVVPQLAEVIIREHVERLVNERQKR